VSLWFDGPVEWSGNKHNLCTCNLHTSKLLLEEVHTQNTIDVSRVVAEENATKGCKDAQKVAVQRDRRLDTIVCATTAMS